MKNSHFLIKFVLTILTSISLLSCSEPPTEDPDPTPVITHQLGGNVAIGVPARYSEVCTFHTQNICTRANRNGDYILNEVTGDQGWLKANYIDTSGAPLDLYSAYFVEDEIFDAIVNINPTTDIISKIWLADSQNLDLETCIETDCFTTTNAIVNQSVFEIIENNLATVLSPMWPEYYQSIRTGDYIADPNVNELDLMHELINYQLDFENQNLEIWNYNNLLLASVPISDLTDAGFDANSGLFDVVSESEMEESLPFRAPAPTGVPEIDIVLIINPSTYGVAPFNFLIDTSATRTSLVDATLSFSHSIISPDSSLMTWSETSHSGTLTVGGTHDVIVHVTASSGEQAIMGATIELERDENTPATYGGAGSCRPENLTINDLNICIELLDGGTIDQCNENEQFIEVNNRCSRTIQLEGSYIGNCELVENEVNRVHYQNPLKIYNETLAQQQTRLQSVCEADFGIWFN